MPKVTARLAARWIKSVNIWPLHVPIYLRKCMRADRSVTASGFLPTEICTRALYLSDSNGLVFALETTTEPFFIY